MLVAHASVCLSVCLQDGSLAAPVSPAAAAALSVVAATYAWTAPTIPQAAAHAHTVARRALLADRFSASAYFAQAVVGLMDTAATRQVHTLASYCAT